MKIVSKERIISLFFLIAFYILAVYIFPKINILNHVKSKNYEQTVVKPKPNDSVPQPSELFNNKQILTENRPALLHVRKAFNAYLAGTNEGILEEAIKSRVIEGFNFGLESFSKDYYSSKFVVFAMRNSDYDDSVYIFHIMFLDKPDKLFRVLVKKEQNEYLFLGIYQLSELSEEQTEKFKEIFKDLSGFIWEIDFAIF